MADVSPRERPDATQSLLPEVPAPAAPVDGRQRPTDPLRVQVIGSVSVSGGDGIVASQAAAPFGADLQVGAAIGMGCVLAERADRRAAGYAADAIEACRRGGSPEQLAGTLPTAAMVCWQVGELAAASHYVTEAMPLLAGSRRIARVVLLTVAAGIALADGDLDAAIDLGTNADVDASELGIERELPLIRCIVARALLHRGDTEAAAAMARRAVEATRSLTFSFPLAVCLETVALICLRQQAGAAVSARLLAAAAQLRARGDRPGPPTLRAAVDQARSDAGLAPAARSAAGAGDDHALDVLAVADLAISALGPAEIGAISQSAAPA